MTRNRPTVGMRDAAVAVAMLAGLVLTVGGAYLLVRDRHHEARKGAEILGGIREEGLAAYWEEDLTRFWQIDGDGGGWSVRIRRRSEDGGFWGIDVQMTPGGEGSWEYWTLNANATRGSYAAGSLRDRQVGPVIRPGLVTGTRIRLEDGVVRAEQFLQTPSQLAESEAPVPDNYVPEGTLPLLRARVAALQEAADFQIVVNNVPPLDGRTSFRFVRYRPVAAPDSAPARAKAVRSRRQIRLQDGAMALEEYVYVVDEEGNDDTVLYRLLTMDGRVFRKRVKRPVAPELALAAGGRSAWALAQAVAERVGAPPEALKPPGPAE